MALGVLSGKICANLDIHNQNESNIEILHEIITTVLNSTYSSSK